MTNDARRSRSQSPSDRQPQTEGQGTGGQEGLRRGTSSSNRPGSPIGDFATRAESYPPHDQNPSAYQTREITSVVPPPAYQTREIVPLVHREVDMPPAYQTREIVPLVHREVDMPPAYQTREQVLTEIGNTAQLGFSGDTQFMERNLEYPTEWNDRSKRPGEDECTTSDIDDNKISTAFASVNLERTETYYREEGIITLRDIDGEKAGERKQLFDSYLEYGAYEHVNHINDKDKEKLLLLDIRRSGVVLGRQLRDNFVERAQIKQHEEYFYSRIKEYLTHASRTGAGTDVMWIMHGIAVDHLKLGTKKQEEYTDSNIQKLVEIDLAQMQRNAGMAYASKGRSSELYRSFRNEYKRLCNLINDGIRQGNAQRSNQRGF